MSSMSYAFALGSHYYWDIEKEPQRMIAELERYIHLNKS